MVKLKQLVLVGVLISVCASAQILLGTAPQAAVGSSVSNGHTRNAPTITFPAIAVGGTTTTIPAIDSVSGAAGVGSRCEIGSANATPLPFATIRWGCTITAPGVATITAFPENGIALGQTSFSANVFWWW